MRGFRMKGAIITFIVVLVLGFFLNYLHRTTQVIIPLTQKLQAVPGVSDVRIENGVFNNSPLQVKLKLEEESSLPSTISHVWEVLEAAGGTFFLDLEDSANEELLALYRKVQLVAEEAVVTGNFTLLEERVETLAYEHGLEADLAVDRKFIYLTLKTPSNTLRRMITRSTELGRIGVVGRGVS